MCVCIIGATRVWSVEVVTTSASSFKNARCKTNIYIHNV